MHELKQKVIASKFNIALARDGLASCRYLLFVVVVLVIAVVLVIVVVVVIVVVSFF